MSCLSKQHRLNSKKDFNELYKSGKKWHTDSFVAFYKPAQETYAAFVTSKRVGNAVHRNRARRRLRALFLSYENKTLTGKYIFVAKDKIHENDFAKLKKDFQFAFKRLELLK
ncbi:ribonuclease P protein component [Candidatus Marinarcus aquaticus]|uniref:Ribonuclease P protein component n=1 Tax=Candidatus Marinarcus aquaticus TaxID=2044504 RepID=A0A4Q0XRL8_9BACT|nr:ribonuclease P protein component [Candidatus Marinarcus aquaticus]